jgi:uncharacterized lipoprotein YddW (UPF0748 family)
VLFRFVFSTSQAIWVTRFALQEKQTLINLLRFSEKNNISDVFIQIRGRGDIFYYSDIEKNHRNSHYQENLVFLLHELKKRNIRSHAWLNVFLMASSFSQIKTEKTHFLYKNQNIIDFSEKFISLNDEIRSTKDIRHIEGLYATPTSNSLLYFYQALVKEIIHRFNFDGIHLDYFRLASGKHGYHPKMRRLFFENFGERIETYLNSKNSVTNFGLIKSWKNFVASQYSFFLKKLKNSAPEKKWSVAVKPNIQSAKWKYGQDWIFWLEKGYVDFVVPMNYSPSDETFHKFVNNYSKSEFKEKIWVGIATYNQDVSDLKKRVKEMKNKQFHVSLFSFNDLNNKSIENIF